VGRRGSGRLGARLAAIAAAVVVAVVAGAPAAFAATGRIDAVTPTPTGRLAVVFSGVGLEQGATIDPQSVQVKLNGQVVPSTAKPITSAVERRTMLVIDTSDSMRAPTGGGVSRLEAAKSAADAYLTAVPADVSVGLLTFDSVTTLKVPVTQDRTQVRAALKTLTTSPGTALFDGVVQATTELGSKGVRNILLLADGANGAKSTNTLGSAITAVRTSGVGLDAVSLAGDALQASQLQALATAGGGQVVSATQADELAAAFEAAAAAQATQVVIDVVVPADLAGKQATVEVTARAGVQTITDTSAALMPATTTAVPTDIAQEYGPVAVEPVTPGITAQSWFLPVAIAAVGLGLFVMLAVALMSTDRENQTSGRVRRRLSRYSLAARAEPTTTVATSGALGQSQVARSAVELAGRVTQSRDFDTGLAVRLEAAGVPLKPAEWLLVHLGIAIVTTLVFMLLSGFGVLATIVGLIIGITVPYVYLSYKEGKRKKQFAAQLPDTLQLLAGSLAAGYSLPQAVDTVARESGGPMAVELNRALVEARLGVPLEDAMETTARRMNSVDFAWVVMAIRIQREVGGNLAEVLSNVAATMRERERLRRQVQVLSAEGRLSAWILGALPVVFAIYLILVRPEYVGLLITTPLGIIMVIGGVLLMIGGAFWLSRVVKVEV
jgi:tight adherence protein B